MKTKIIIILTALFFIQASCKKQKQRPTGNHTLSCYIDGELFIPKDNFDIYSAAGSGLSIEYYPKYYNNDTDFFFIEATDHNKYTLIINLYDKIEQNKKYYFQDGIDDPYSNVIISRVWLKSKNGKYLSKQGSGWIEFSKFDTIAGDYKGKFEFDLYNKDNPNDVIHVTDGIFDN